MFGEMEQIGDVLFELEQAEKVISSENEVEGNVLTVEIAPIFTLLCCK